MKKPIPVTIRGSVLACVVVTVWCFQPGTVRLSAEPAWSAQSATDRVISVASVAALNDAIAHAASGSTIVIAPGVYELTRSLRVRNPVSNLTIRGGSDNAGDVVLLGRGMSNPNFGDVPHGIIVEGGVSYLTIANLTIRDVYKHSILLLEGTKYARIHNVRLVDGGDHLLKANGDLERGGSANTVVEYSTLEYTSTTREANTGGIFVAGGSGWSIRQNSFRNIQAPVGQLAFPAVLMSQGSRDSIVEGNLFMNCQREISLGQQERSPDDHARGIVRNNFIYRDSIMQGDVAILIADSPQSQVLHNTILTNGSYGTAIEYRFTNTTGTIVKNNLTDRRIVATKGATGTSTGNYTQALPSMFVNAAAGNLHLAAGVSVLFDQVPVVDDALMDFDGDSRQPGGMADYGADERDNLRDATTSDGTTTVSPEPSPTTSGEVTSPAPTTDTSTTETSKGKGKKPPVDAGTLPLPWEVMDIGGSFGGSASASGGTFTVRGGGADIAGNSDQFTFVYQMLEGDGDLVARVAKLDGARTGAKAGIMVRNGLNADAKYAASFLVSGRGLAFQTRIANGATTSNSGTSAGSAPQWLKLVRAGDTFTAFSSTDGIRWKVLGTEVVYLDQRVYVGLAVTSHAKQLVTAQFTNVTVTPTGTSTNKPPSVAIATPSSGTSYNVGDQIEIAATAGDTDGSVTKVEFYSGSTLIGTSVSSPFRCNWSNVSTGRHSLKAVAYDNEGASAASAPVDVDVAAPANQAPVVSLTSPASGASYIVPASITLSASASDPDGSIAKVEFFAGSTRIGSVTSSPYSVAWSGAAPGSYTLTAVAWDNNGLSATSGAVTVTVLGNQAPSVALTGPKAGTTYTEPATITFTATASDPDGTIARVEFLVLGVVVGSDSSSPYSWSTSGLSEGTYALTARAIDNAGATTTSAPVSITVNPPPVGQRILLFNPSADHATVMSYRVELFTAGANPLTAAPVLSQNIGKPAPVNGDIATDVSAMVNGTPSGEYFFSVVAIASTGTSRSAPSATFVR